MLTMENSKHNDTTHLEKTIREQNLKFSVEFENGEIAGNKELANREAEEVHAEESIDEFETFQKQTFITAEETNDDESVQDNNAIHIQTKLNRKSPEKRDVTLNGETKYTTSKTYEHIAENQESIETKDNRVLHKGAKGSRKHKKAKQNVPETDMTVLDEKHQRKRKAEEANPAKSEVKLPPIKGSQQSPRESKSFGKLQRSEASGKKWEKPGDTGEIPIQARIRGPGPGHYMLPSTLGSNADLTKRHSPAFSFGSRSWSFKTDSPGPAYAVDPLLGPRGKENRPSFSFGARLKTPPPKNVTPGPGAYNTDRPPLWERIAPKYSMSTRNKMRSVDQVPSPNVYQLPSTLGDRVPHQRGAPAVSMLARREKQGYAEDLANTPGPARYGAFSPSLTKRKSPEYSVLGRNHVTMNKNFTPGPGAYNPQDVNSHLEKAPRHVIGVRHSEFVMPTLTPADISD